MRPVQLGPNQPRHYYRGGGRIVDFRGPDSGAVEQPEDWIGSTTTRYGQSPVGLTTLPDGTLLKDAVAADPEGWLGTTHVQRYGADTSLLVKLLDAGERLPVHCHPSRGFAAEHLHAVHGKTEAWLILEADEGASVHLGFSAEVDPDQLATWVHTGDHDALLAATTRMPIATGDTVLVPAGLPHSIGQGVFLAELQEPTDFSVLLEHDADAGPDASLDLAWDEALACVDRTQWTPERVTDQLIRHPESNAVLLPPSADPYFRAERVVGERLLDPSFAVLIVTEGAGRLGDTDVRKGQTYVIPFGAGPLDVTGDVTLLRCLPPAP